MAVSTVGRSCKVEIVNPQKISYLKAPGSGSGGYASHHTQKTEILIKFWYQDGEIFENIYKDLLTFFGRKKISKKLKEKIKSAKLESILIDVNSTTREYIGVNKESLENWFKRI